jgi:hypothetical protein
MQRQQAYVPTAYPLDEEEPSSNGLTINGMLFDNSRGGLAANLLGDDPYSPPLSPAVGSQAYTAAIMVRAQATRLRHLTYCSCPTPFVSHRQCLL